MRNTREIVKTEVGSFSDPDPHLSVHRHELAMVIALGAF